MQSNKSQVYVAENHIRQMASIVWKSPKEKAWAVTLELGRDREDSDFHNKSICRVSPVSDDQCAWASINLQCLHPNRRCCDVPISRESCKKSTWKTAGKSSINSVANTFPNHQCRKEKEEKKRSTPVLLTLLAFFAIQRLRESLKDPKEKSQETKAHLLLALNTKSTLLLYKKNPLSSSQ